MLNKLNTTLRSAAIAALTLGVAAASLSAPAQASTRIADEVSATVYAADLETQRGQMRVYQELERKAQIACGASHGGLKSLSQRAAASLCTQDLLDDFITDLNHAAVTAIHTNRSAG